MSSLTLLTAAPLLVASMIFAAEKMFVGAAGLTTQTNQHVQSYSADFLLTRAIDRPILFRARAVLYWILIGLPLLVLLVLTIWRPALQIEMPLKAPNHADYYLSHLQGAEIIKTTSSTQVVGTPYGNVELAVTMVMFGLAAAAIWQAVVFCILKVPFRRFIVMGVFMGSIAAGPFLIGRSIDGSISRSEATIIWAMNHPVVCGVMVLGLTVAGYFFCAARDRQLEYP